MESWLMTVLLQCMSCFIPYITIIVDRNVSISSLTSCKQSKCSSQLKCDFRDFVHLVEKNRSCKKNNDLIFYFFINMIFLILFLKILFHTLFLKHCFFIDTVFPSSPLCEVAQKSTMQEIHFVRYCSFLQKKLKTGLVIKSLLDFARSSIELMKAVKTASLCVIYCPVYAVCFLPTQS